METFYVLYTQFSLKNIFSPSQSIGSEELSHFSKRMYQPLQLVLWYYFLCSPDFFSSDTSILNWTRTCLAYIKIISTGSKVYVLYILVRQILAMTFILSRLSLVLLK